jgi:mutator protein MutT
LINKVELFDAYDQNENKLNIDLIRGEKHPPGLYHLVVEIYTINENNEILVTRRHQDKTFPLLWEITGGSVIKGESLLEGAKRELEEETGIKVNEEDLHLIYKTTSGDSLYRSFITFIKTNEQIITLQDEETIDYKWIPIYAFAQFILSPKFVYTIKNRFLEFKDTFFQIIKTKKE